MTAHTWRTLIGAVFCTGLLSGCTPLFGLWPSTPEPGSDKAVTDKRLPVDPPPDERTQHQTSDVTSGYHQTVLFKRDPILDGKVGPAGYTGPVPVPAGVDVLEPLPTPKDALLSLPKPQPEIKTAAPAPKAVPAEPPVPLVAALTCLLKTPTSDAALQEAMHHLKSYSRPNEELFLRILPILAELTRSGVDKMTPEQIAQLQEQAQGLLMDLRAHSKLVIDRMCLVSKIEGPGTITLLPIGHQFLPRLGDRPGEQVLIYVELHNVGSIKKAENCYETSLTGSVELIPDGSGQAAYTYNLRSQSRPMRSPIACSECYRGYTFWVPAIPAGKYTLRLTIKDETRGGHNDVDRVEYKEFFVATTDVAAN